MSKKLKVLFIADESEFVPPETPGIEVIYTGIGLTRKDLIVSRLHELIKQGYDFSFYNLGSVGSLHHAVGSVFHVAQCFDKTNTYNLNLMPDAHTNAFSRVGIVKTSDVFVSSAEAQYFGHDVLIDMELTKIKSLLSNSFKSLSEDPFYSIKIVSDNLNGSYSEWVSSVERLKGKFIGQLKHIEEHGEVYINFESLL